MYSHILQPFTRVAIFSFFILITNAGFARNPTTCFS